MIHVWSDHVDYSLGLLFALGLGPLDCHFLQLQDIWMRQQLHDLYFAQGGDWKAILLAVHENLLQGDDGAGLGRARSVDLTKSSLAELAQDIVVANA